jgi:cytochrome c-type biogenesis protein CcmH/NrfG
MSESLAGTPAANGALGRIASRPSLSVPWRDPHAIPPTELAAYIGALEQACLDNPQSADLRTVLGMAHAVNYDVPQSMEALEVAVSLDPTTSGRASKYAELHYRLRA